ncbi:hypothetical protein BGY98DRAFT_365684 [Russula aff. rugulosa BPL654]|nr:hypothetical protein BGY98DRAFT_365684 [Russula aff. rugulosa BPL654]
MSPKKIPTSLAVCRWDKTDTLDPSVHEAKVKSSMYKSYVTMHRYASGKSSSIHPLFSCVQRAKISSHAHAETSAPPRHYFFASRAVQRGSGIALATYSNKTANNYSGPDKAGARRSEHSRDPRHLACSFSIVSYHIIVPGHSPNFPIKFVSGRSKLSVVAPITGTRWRVCDM